MIRAQNSARSTSTNDPKELKRLEDARIMRSGHPLYDYDCDSRYKIGASVPQPKGGKK